MAGENSVDVRHVAELARLNLAEAEIPAMQRDMEAIVAYIGELQQVDVTGVEPTAHAAKLNNVWREDVHRDSFDRSAMLSCAPALVKEELIRVPRVLPGNEE